MKESSKMKFTKLNINEYRSFVEQQFSHYTQSMDLYDYRINRAVGFILSVLKKTVTLLFACLLTDARIFKVFKYYYTHRGPVMDFTNLALVEFFFKN